MDEQGFAEQPFGDLDENTKANRPWFKKKRFIIPIGLIVIFGFAGALGGGESDTSDPTVAETSTESSNSSNEDNGATTSDDSAETEEIETDSFTTSQSNAIESAESYLRFTAFSRTGLIDQLEFEGFSNADASFAVDTINPDWFEQAAKSAESYLDFSSFSRQGLIDQLEFEGFTTEEATFGADSAGLGESSSESSGSGGETVSQSNAVESAESYLRFSSFSRSGLIDQLEFEGYSNADATYAVDKVNPDWFEQAAKSAKSYLDFSSFSRQGLIDQLEFEGFTTQEAIYGVEQNGF
jgi:hypothetical protein